MFKILFPGSILAVTISDPHAQGKTNRFVGICIERKGCGLRAEFILRNVIDHQGVEVSINVYLMLTKHSLYAQKKLRNCSNVTIKTNNLLNAHPYIISGQI